LPRCPASSHFRSTDTREDALLPSSCEHERTPFARRRVRLSPLGPTRNSPMGWVSAFPRTHDTGRERVPPRRSVRKARPALGAARRYAASSSGASKSTPRGPDGAARTSPRPNRARPLKGPRFAERLRVGVGRGARPRGRKEVPRPRSPLHGVDSLESVSARDHAMLEKRNARYGCLAHAWPPFREIACRGFPRKTRRKKRSHAAL
jgi:hypothetical protein